MDTEKVLQFYSCLNQLKLNHDSTDDINDGECERQFQSTDTVQQEISSED